MSNIIDLDKIPETNTKKSSGTIINLDEPTGIETSQSKYDTGFVLPKENTVEALNQNRAQHQEILDKWSNGIVKATGVAGTSVVEGFGDLLYGIPKALSTGKFSSIYDNELNKGLDEVNQTLQSKFPNYYTKAEQDASLLGEMGHANFWSDKVLNGLGFTVGAITTGLLTGGIGDEALGLSRASEFLSSIAKLTDAEKAARLSEEGIKTIDELNKFTKGIKFKSNVDALTSNVIATNTEAAIEARQGKEEFIKARIKDIKDKEHREPTDDELHQIEDYSDSVGNVRYALNFPVIGLSNFVQFHNLLGGNYLKEAKALNNITKNAEGVFEAESPNLTSKIFSALKNPVAEAQQELSQQIIQVGVDDYFKNKYDHKGQASIDDMIHSIGKGLSETLGTKEGLEQGLIGGLIGIIGFPIPGHIGGGIKEGLDESKERDQNTQLAVKALNDYKLSDNFKPLYDASVAHIASQNKKDQALQNKDIFAYKNAETQQFFNLVNSRIETGQFKRFTDEIDNYSQLPENEFKKSFGFKESEPLPKGVHEFLNDIKTKANEVYRINQSIEQNFPAFSKEAKEVLNFLSYGISDIDKREKDLTNKLFSLSGIDYSSLRKTNKTDYKSKLDEQYNLIKSDINPVDKLESDKTLIDLKKLTASRELFLKAFDKISTEHENVKKRSEEIAKEEEKLKNQRKQEESKSVPSEPVENKEVTEPSIELVSDKIVKGEELTPEEEQFRQNNSEEIEQKLQEHKAKEPIQLTKNLRTWDLGNLEGTKQTEKAQSKLNNTLINKPDEIVDKTGESFNTFANRVLTEVKNLIQTLPNNGVIVTHNSAFGLIKAWDIKGRLDILDKNFREFYTSQEDNAHDDFYTLKGVNGNIRLVRHGETEDNINGLFRRSDTTLTDSGKKDIETISNKFKEQNIHPTKIASSDLQRAHETAKGILEKTKITPEESSFGETNIPETPLESQNEEKTLATAIINEDSDHINFTRSIEDYWNFDNGARKVSLYTQEGGKDNMSEESANRLYRFNNKNSPTGLQGQLITRKNNPKLYEEILELDVVAKDFEAKYKTESKEDYQGIWMITTKNGKPVLADKDGNISDKGKMVINTITSASSIENGRIKVTNSKDRQEIAKAKAQSIIEITRFRNEILNSEKSVFVNYTNKSKGHVVTESTKNGLRQSFPVIGRLADNAIDIQLALPTIVINDKPGKGLLKNGQIADIGKLYAFNKNGNSIDLIPRLLNEAEQDKVYHLILQKLGVEERQSQTISEELNKLIYFGIPKTGPTENTLGQAWNPAGAEESVIVIGKTRQTKATLSTEEGQARLREFLKNKRVNVNTKYGFEDQFTDIFGDKHNSYKDYLITGENALFGTDLVKNNEIQFKNQYFTYDPFIKEKEIKESTVTTKKKFEKKTNTELDRLKILETNTGIPLTKEETTWFKSNFPNIPVEVVKGLIDNKSFGRFLSSGKILLSDEATFGTLYHEAFHTISQLYLSKRELQELYKETKERTKAKTDLEAEEILAEDFISYKKTGRVLGQAYKRNDIFRKIINFIKDLLNIPISSIEDIYRRIDKGFYKNKPTKESIQFKSLNRSKISKEKGIAFEAEVLSNINALYYDELFKGNRTPGDITLKISNTLSDRIFNQIVEQYEAETNIDKANNLQYVLENWNDVIETFRQKSKANNIDIPIVGDNDTDLSVAEEENKDSNDTAFQETNQKSTKSSMNDNVWTLITSLKQINKDGSIKISDLTGLPLSINPTTTYNFLLKQLSGLSTFEEIYNKIDKLADTKPELIDLLEKLGQPSSTNSYSQQLFQNQFRQDFGKNRMTSHKTILKADGTIYIVDANNENNAGRILEKWQNNIYNSTTQDVDGKIILDLNKVQFGNPETFLNSIGFNLSPETIEQAKEENEFIPIVLSLQNYIKEKKGDITTLFSPTKEEKEAKSDIKGNLTFLSRLEADNNPESAELSFTSTEGKTVYSIGYNNALSIIKNTINNSKTKVELFERLPHLNTVSTEGSIWMSELFDSKGNKRKDRNIELNLHDGLATDTENETNAYKASTRKLSTGDKWVQEINSILLDGRSSYIRASDKSSEHTLNLNKFGKNQRLFIPIEDLHSLDNPKLKDTFQDYFASELKRIALHKVLGLGNDIDIFNTAGSKFTVFEGILSGETKKEINEAIETLKQEDRSQEELVPVIDALAATFNKQVSDDVEAFFTKYSEEIRNDIKDAKISKEQGISSEFGKYSLEQLTNTIAVNDFINSVEQTKLFIGDMAFYKDLFKRTSGFSGTKQTASNSSSINEWINTNFTRLDGKVENGEIHAAVFEDVNQSLQAELLDGYIDALVESGHTKEEAQVILKAYTSMDEGDAQGWITLDEYRSFMTRLGKKIPQAIFEKAQKGQVLAPDEMFYFTVIKAQYAGPQQYSTIYSPAYHKYSLLPLLPSMVKGKNIQTVLDTMTKNKVGYALFKSGSKVGTKVTNGKANKFYTDTNNGEINTQNWQKQVVSYDFLGLQTETSEPHNTVIFGTQFRKLLFSNQFAEGKEIIKGSKKLENEYNSIIDKLVNKEKKALIKELGINPDTYKSEDVKKIVNLLQQEAKDRNLADNLIDGLQSEIIDGKLLLKYKFDAMVTKNKIDSILMSLVNSRLIRQKITGDALIQVSSSGFENKGNRKSGTNAALRGYTQDNDEKTLPAEVMIPLSKEYNWLLEKYGTLNKVNQAIKNGEISKKALQLVAYRIPTQGFNSMEFFEVKEFLPTESSTSIVVPTEIVAKSGSDFDVDKLNVIKRGKGDSDKVALQNQLMDIATDILSHKDNFAALITPNSSEILKSVANEIRFIEHLNAKPDPDLIRSKFETQEEYDKAYNEKKDKYIKAVADTLKSNIRYTNQLKLSGKEGKIAQFTKFMTAKDMIGIAAIQNTHNILAQTHNLTIDGNQAKINLVANKVENGDISISKQKDVDGKNLISEVISQTITATVDAAKDPFLFDINMTMETLGTAMYLVRTGVPFETVGYFLAQPIISEYLKELSTNKSGFLKALGKEDFKKQLIGRVKSKYGKDLPKDYQNKVFSQQDLKNNLYKANQNKDFNFDQLQVLNDFLSYQEQAQNLSDAMRATNMDTAGVGKNLNTIQAKLDLIKQVKTKGFVKGIESVLDNSIVKTFDQLEFTKQAFSQFYYTQSPEFVEVKQDIIDTVQPFGEANRDKLASLIENDLITFVVQNWGYPNITELRSKLMVDKDSNIAKKLLDLKNKKNKNTEEIILSKNLLIRELQPLLSTKKRDVNNIRTYTKRYDTFVSNQLTEAFREVKELMPDLAKDLMDLGIIQSGLNNSPITYLGIIPFEYYNDLVKKAFENFDKKNGVSKLGKFENLFLRNNKFNPIIAKTAKKLTKLGNDMYGKNYILSNANNEDEEDNKPQLLKPKKSTTNLDKLPISIGQLNQNEAEAQYKELSKTYPVVEKASYALTDLKGNQKVLWRVSAPKKANIEAIELQEETNNRNFPQQSRPAGEQNISEQSFREIADKLVSKMQGKVNYKIVSPDEAIKTLESLGLNAQEYGFDKNNVPAFYDNKGNIIFPSNYLTAEVAFHEFAHPFVDTILEQNKPLYLRLRRELQDSEAGKQIIKDIKKEYPWLVEKDQLIDKGWKEAITTSIGKMAENQLNSSKDKGLIDAIKQLLKRIGEYLQSVFSNPNKEIKPIEISPTTTLAELASMLNLENKIDLSKSKSPEVKYNLKAVEFLASEKATQLFNKFFKNNKEKFFQEITQSIGKDQLALIKDIVVNESPETLGDIMTSLLANYSYTIEINTAKNKLEINKDTVPTTYEEYNSINAEEDFVGDVKQDVRVKKTPGALYYWFPDKPEWNRYQKVILEESEGPTQHYSDLTVPGSTNYTENEIAIPNITPSIKGHAAFSTNNGIGWFRSDDRQVNGEYKAIGQDLADLSFDGEGRPEPRYVHTGTEQTKIGEATKTRRILEVQSDLFQKGRDKTTLTFGKNKLDQSDLDDLKEDLQDGKITQEKHDLIIHGNTKGSSENQFLQLLNKDNNWVTFFVKSIIQDSAKKGYEKVLFPNGNTAAKIEGHRTLEDFKKQKEDRIKELENQKKVESHTIVSAASVFTSKISGRMQDSFNEEMKEKAKPYLDKYIVLKKEFNNRDTSDGIYLPDSLEGIKLYNSEESARVASQEEGYYQDKEIEQLKKELERVEKEGFAALKPIFKFYEENVKNILKKNYQVNEVKDEYGNTWNEVGLSNITTDIQLKKRTKTEEEKKSINESPFTEQYVFYKRRLTALEKQLKEVVSNIERNKIEEEIKTIESKFNEAHDKQSQKLYKELGVDTLKQAKEYIDTLKEGEPEFVSHINYAKNVIDAFREFPELEEESRKLRKQLFPFIEKSNIEAANKYSTRSEQITKEQIDAQDKDINSIKEYTGYLGDSPNILASTIGMETRNAQNKVETDNKKISEDIQNEVNHLYDWSKKNGVKDDDVYEVFIQEHKGSTIITKPYFDTGEENPNYNKIQNTPELKRFYDFYQKTVELYGDKLSTKIFGLKNFIPNVEKHTLTGSVKKLKPVKTVMFNNISKNEELLNDAIPKRYIKKLESKSKSRDLGNALLEFAAMSNNYEQMNNILPQVRLIQEGIKYKVTPSGEVIERRFKKSSNINETIPGEQSNIFNQTQKFIEMQVLGKMKMTQGQVIVEDILDENGKVIGVKVFNITGLIDDSLAYNSMLRIGFGFVTPLANVGMGDASSIIEAIGGRFFNLKELTQAKLIFISQNLKEDSEQNKWLEKLNPLMEMDDYKTIQQGIRTKMSIDKVKEWMYSPMKWGEKFIQAPVMTAMLIREGYMTSNGETTEEGKKLLEGKDDLKADKLAQKIQWVIGQNQGRYSAKEASIAQQHVIFRMVSQFRKFIPAAFENRFGEYQHANRAGVDFEGRYSTFGREVLLKAGQGKIAEAMSNLLLPIISAKKALEKGNLTELEIHNMRKMVSEILIILGSILLYGGLFGDKDRYKKWRKNFYVKTGLSVINRVSGDLTFFYSPEQTGYMAQNAVPLAKTLGDVIQVARNVPAAFYGKDSQYKTGSRKNENKFYNPAMRLIPGVNQIPMWKRLIAKEQLEELR